MTVDKYALLDYDGFVCKAFWAAVSRGEPDTAIDVLDNLVYEAIKKAENYFDGQDIKVVKIMSGHTYKKDIYPDYKSHRKKDEFFGIFREKVIQSDDTILRVPLLEADDIIIMLSEKIDDCIIFSDDKDLKYYSKLYCKINLNEQIQQHDTDSSDKYIQMLAGDKEDNISGIPNVGKVKALKLLGGDYSLAKVVDIYKAKHIDLDECIKQIVLVSPISAKLNKLLGYIDMDRLIALLENNNDYVISKIIGNQLDWIQSYVKNKYQEN